MGKKRTVPGSSKIKGEIIMVENVKTKANKVFNSIGFIIILGIAIFLKTLLFYNCTIAVSEPLGIETLIGSAFFIVILVCFICILPNRARIITGIIASTIISLILFGDNVYYIYSNSALSVAQITNLQYGEEIISTLPTILSIEQILYFLDIIVIVILLSFKILKIEKKPKKTKIQRISKVVAGTIGIIVFCFLVFGYVEKGKQKSYNKDLQIREATIYGYHIYDIENSINIKRNSKYKDYESMIVDYEELKNDYEENYGNIKYDLKGISENKNVIVVQLESVQEFVLHKEINGGEIIPNLNKFLDENIEFTNMNMQSYSTTADSEHSTITSIYPLENGMSFSKYYTNDYDDIFKIFSNANYNTSYMHGNYPYFWNRGNVYGRLQIDELSLKEQFDDLSENINGDLSDELLYRQAVQKLKNYNQPFFTYIVSASSHTPFILEGLQDRSKISIDVGKYKGTYFGNYLEAVNYADYSFGIFIDELKKENLYEDSTILVFGDHNGLNMYNDELIEFLYTLNPELTEVDIKLNYTKVAAGMKLPETYTISIGKPVNKLDIKPTLTYLCNIEDGFSLGTNMFESKDFVCLNNERIISENYYYDGQWYDIKSGKAVEFENLQEDEKKRLEKYYNNMRTELEISQSVSVNNLLERNGKNGDGSK